MPTIAKTPTYQAPRASAAPPGSPLRQAYEDWEEKQLALGHVRHEKEQTERERERCRMFVNAARPGDPMGPVAEALASIEVCDRHLTYRLTAALMQAASAEDASRRFMEQMEGEARRNLRRPFQQSRCRAGH